MSKSRILAKLVLEGQYKDNLIRAQDNKAPVSRKPDHIASQEDIKASRQEAYNAGYSRFYGTGRTAISNAAKKTMSIPHPHSNYSDDYLNGITAALKDNAAKMGR